MDTTITVEWELAFRPFGAEMRVVAHPSPGWRARRCRRGLPCPSWSPLVDPQWSRPRPTVFRSFVSVSSIFPFFVQKSLSCHAVAATTRRPCGGFPSGGVCRLFPGRLPSLALYARSSLFCRPFGSYLCHPEFTSMLRGRRHSVSTTRGIALGWRVLPLFRVATAPCSPCSPCSFFVFLARTCVVPVIVDRALCRDHTVTASLRRPCRASVRVWCKLPPFRLGSRSL